MAITLGGSSGGGGGGSPFPTMFFQQSMTWACPVAMEALVYVIGGGGSGGDSTTTLGTCMRPAAAEQVDVLFQN